jgi:hypothetical protein
MGRYKKPIINTDRLNKTESFSLSIRTGKSANFGITYNVLEKLGLPKWLEFWWSESKRILFITASDIDSPAGLELPYNIYFVDNIRSKIYNSLLLHKIADLYGWEKNTYARFYGEYIPEINMVAFKLSSVSIQG